MNSEQEIHFEGKVAQKVILVKENTVLITRDSRDEVWELPGGRLNKNENPILGVMREVTEELGVEIVVGKIVYINQFQHTKDKSTALVIVYEASLADSKAVFEVDPVEVAQMEWVDKESWQSYDYYPEYKQALNNYFSE